MAVRFSGCLMATASVLPHSQINIRSFPLISSDLQELSTLLGLLVVIIVIITVRVTIIITNRAKQRASTSLFQPSTLHRLLLCQGLYQLPASPVSGICRTFLWALLGYFLDLVKGNRNHDASCKSH